jgi:hypothetical protein
MEHIELRMNVLSRYFVLLWQKLGRRLALVTIDVGLQCKLYDVI